MTIDDCDRDFGQQARFFKTRNITSIDEIFFGIISVNQVTPFYASLFTSLAAAKSKQIELSNC